MYRRRFLRRWVAWDPTLLTREFSTVDDALLPSEKARSILNNCPLPIDVGCMTVTANSGRAVCVLLPSGCGKTTAGLRASGISTEFGPGQSLTLTVIKDARYRIFCSDMAWISVVRGRLCLCRPRAERSILAWDMARMLARRKLGKRRFEAERNLPISKRTHTRLFRRFNVKRNFHGLTSEDICFPEVIILGDFPSIKRGDKTKQKHVGNIELLESGLLNQAIQQSKFWHGTPELQHRITLIIKAIQISPQIHSVSIEAKGFNLDKLLEL